MHKKCLIYIPWNKGKWIEKTEKALREEIKWFSVPLYGNHAEKMGIGSVC